MPTDEHTFIICITIQFLFVLLHNCSLMTVFIGHLGIYYLTATKKLLTGSFSVGGREKSGWAVFVFI